MVFSSPFRESWREAPERDLLAKNKMHNITSPLRHSFGMPPPPKVGGHSKELAALYKLCAAPSLRTTHYALRTHKMFHVKHFSSGLRFCFFLIPNPQSLSTGYWPPATSYHLLKKVSQSHSHGEAVPTEYD